MPPTLMRSNLRPSAAAIERPSDVLPTPGGPTKQRIEPRASGFSRRTARNSRMRSLTRLDVVVVGVEHLARVVEVEVVLRLDLSHGSVAIHSR